MRKINYFLSLLLFLGVISTAKADDHTLSLGNFDELVEGDWDESQCYTGSWYMASPTQFYALHTGSQVIYTKNQLASMAGKEIKSISFLFNNQSVYSALPRTIKVWAQEVGNDAFAYDQDNKAYQYFEYAEATPVVASYDFEDDFLDYFDGANHALTIPFDQPFAYSGDKNLLITVTFDGDEATDGPESLEFYYNPDAANLSMTACSDQVTFDEFHDSEDWPAASNSNSKLSHGTQLYQPLTQFTYQESTAPVVKPATLSGVVKCGEQPVANATVTLTSGEVKYEAVSNDEGSYTLTVDKDNIGKEFTLTASAEGYDNYTATEPVTFASDEHKQFDVELVKTLLPAELYGQVVSSENNQPVSGAVISVKNDDNEYTTTSDDEGNYTLTVAESKATYTLSATADDFEPYTIANYTFTPGEQKEQTITLKKVEHPSNLVGTVTCEGQPVEGAEVKLTATDDKYLTYKTTTGAEGTYLLRVVKSDRTYTLTVTSGECEDYVEENVTFVPDESSTKDIQLTKTPNPENTVTLGKYNKFLREGTDTDLYYGHGYSWAAAPTNFSHNNTGSQILYTKEQLAEMSGKAISQINFIFHNESAYEAYPRTVNVWVEEIDDDAFYFDTKANQYQFFEYTDGHKAITDYEYDGELYNYAGDNGELQLVFDAPVNYSGKKNLLVTLTFEGDYCCNTSDFNFYCNNDVKNKAITYFSDNYTFGDYADTEDWPYADSDCVDELEQPVTRFFYTDPIADGVNAATANSRANGADSVRYNLAGQRVDKSYKGIVISGGKKYVVK